MVLKIIAEMFQQHFNIYPLQSFLSEVIKLVSASLHRFCSDLDSCWGTCPGQFFVRHWYGLTLQISWVSCPSSHWSAKKGTMDWGNTCTQASSSCAKAHDGKGSSHFWKHSHGESTMNTVSGFFTLPILPATQQNSSLLTTFQCFELTLL